MGALTDALAREFGVSTEPRVNPETGTVGTSVVKVAGNNPNRFALAVINLGTAAVFVAPDRAVSAARGFRLDPNGGSLSLLWRDDGHLVGWEWFAVSGTAGQDVFVIESVAR